MQQFPSHFSVNDMVDFLQRRILLNSVAERELGINFLGNDYRKEMVQQLIDLQENYPEATNTRYGYAFKDFNVNHYYGLYLRLNEHDRNQFYKICRLYNNSASDKMENYYILEEYIIRGEDYNGHH